MQGKCLARQSSESERSAAWSAAQTRTRIRPGPRALLLFALGLGIFLLAWRIFLLRNLSVVGQAVRTRGHDTVVRGEAVDDLNPVAIADASLHFFLMRVAVGPSDHYRRSSILRGEQRHRRDRQRVWHGTSGYGNLHAAARLQPCRRIFRLHPDFDSSAVGVERRT